MQPGAAAAGMRAGLPQSLQPAFKGKAPPPPPGKSEHPSLRRPAQHPPPPPPPQSEAGARRPSSRTQGGQGPAPPPMAAPSMSNRPKPRGVRPPGARDLPRRLFPMNSVEKERKQMLVQPIGSSSYGFSAARSSRRSSGLALPRDRFGPLAPIEEGDEERKEGPTLPTKMKPSRHLAENRLRWLRDRLLTRSEDRRNELQLLLPPKVALAVYAMAYMWFGLCFYLIMLHGLRFNPSMEVAWIVASVVSIVQELLIHQLLGLVFNSAFRQLFIPTMTRTLVPIKAGDKLPDASALNDPMHPIARMKTVRKPPPAKVGARSKDVQM